MLAIVTMNLGGFWIPENVMQSHLAAAGRWGAEYLQLVEPGGLIDAPDCERFMFDAGNRGFAADYFAIKRQRIGELEPAFDRIVWLDGDVIVRFDCPCLFDLVPEDHVGGVANYQGESANGRGQAFQSSFFAAISAGTGKPVPYQEGEFINGGVVVYTPRYHSDIWKEDSFGSANGEQTFLNWKIAQGGHKVKVLPSTFNRLGPEAWEPGPMRHYIQHLAHFTWTGKSNRHARGEALRAIDWLKPARELAYA